MPVRVPRCGLWIPRGTGSPGGDEIYRKKAGADILQLTRSLRDSSAQQDPVLGQRETYSRLPCPRRVPYVLGDHRIIEN